MLNGESDLCPSGCRPLSPILFQTLFAQYGLHTIDDVNTRTNTLQAGSILHDAHTVERIDVKTLHTGSLKVADARRDECLYRSRLRAIGINGRHLEGILTVGCRGEVGVLGRLNLCYELTVAINIVSHRSRRNLISEVVYHEDELLVTTCNVTYSHILGAFRNINAYLCPCTGTLRIVRTQLCEAGLAVVCGRGKHLERFCSVAVALQIVHPEADVLSLSGETRSDKPVVSIYEVIARFVQLIDSYKCLCAGMRIKSLSCLEDIGKAASP